VWRVLPFVVSMNFFLVFPPVRPVGRPVGYRTKARGNTKREDKIRENKDTELKTAGHHRIMLWSHAAGSLT